MSERRNNDRLLCAELVQVTYRDASGLTRRTVANLEDISFCGLCLQLEAGIPEDTRIVIQYGDGEIQGTVRHCLFRSEGYFLGVEFNDDYRWSTMDFLPKHLLNPRELVDVVVNRYELN
jgi:hypothetical protein